MPSLLAKSLTCVIFLLTGHVASQTIPDMSKCGQNMGCLHYPVSCVPENCSSILTWEKTNDSNYISFQMMAVSDGWVAFGLSEDSMMGSDSVMDCIMNGSSVGVQFSFNSFYLNNPEPNPGSDYLRNVSGVYSNGRIFCSFQRLVTSSGSIYPLDHPWYLLLGFGTALGGVKNKHGIDPQVSSVRVNVTKDFMDVTNLYTPIVPETGFQCPPNTSCITDGISSQVIFNPLNESGQVLINMMTRAVSGSGWLGLAFSSDSKMENDSVVDCILVSNGTIISKNSYNGLHNNTEINNPNDGLQVYKTSYDNGILQCVVKRQILITNNSKIFSLTEPYYLFIASGPVNGDRKIQHVQKYITPTPLNVTADFSTPTSPESESQTPGPLSSTNSNAFQYKDYKVSFELSDDGFHVEFQITGPVPGSSQWIAVGFSMDQIMGDDSVLDCILLKNGTSIVQHSYNPEHSNVELRSVEAKEGISSVHTSYDNGILTCSFKRNISGFSTPKIFSFNRTYYLLLATGPVLADGSKDQHRDKSYSDRYYNLTASGQGSNATDRSQLVRAHGVLMITAFVMLMSGAIILARYYKTCWPENSICGTAVWFTVHRFLNVLSLLCCAAGFIIIFCYSHGHINGKFAATDPSYFWVHGPLGIVIMILIIVNPVIALFRCEPDHDSRWIFNWIHWFIGTCCHILGGINLFFGIKMGELYYGLIHMSVFWILIAFVGFHVFIELLLLLEKLITTRQSKHRFTIAYGMSTPGEEPSMVKSRATESTRESVIFRYFILTVYVLMTMGLWLAMIIFVGGGFYAPVQ